MKKISILLLFIPYYTIAQEKKIERVPKQISLETGYRNIMSSTFTNKASNGSGFLLDYAWQLSGFNNKKAAYISVPLGYYIMFNDGNGFENIHILSYGWTVRHDLCKNKKFIPFLGYALLLNQLSIENTKGQVFGHQTKFDFGIDYNSLWRIKPFAKIEYSTTRYPSLGNPKSNKMYTFELKAGLRFNKKVK